MTMTDLDPGRLHVSFDHGVEADGPIVPRAYTLTHSDVTGELFLTIGPSVNREQISGWHTRFMRDEVVAAWELNDGPELHVHCHVSGGLVLGGARWRDAIFRRHLPMVLEAFRYGDRALFEAQPELETAPVLVHFHARQPRYDRVEKWGSAGDYALAVDTGSSPEN
jgi:hypothetical protein